MICCHLGGGWINIDTTLGRGLLSSFELGDDVDRKKLLEQAVCFSLLIVEIFHLRIGWKENNTQTVPRHLFIENPGRLPHGLARLGGEVDDDRNRDKQADLSIGYFIISLIFSITVLRQIRYFISDASQVILYQHGDRQLALLSNGFHLFVHQHLNVVQDEGRRMMKMSRLMMMMMVVTILYTSTLILSAISFRISLQV